MIRALRESRIGAKEVGNGLASMSVWGCELVEGAAASVVAQSAQTHETLFTKGGERSDARVDS